MVFNLALRVDARRDPEGEVSARAADGLRSHSKIDLNEAERRWGTVFHTDPIKKIDLAKRDEAQGGRRGLLHAS